MKHRQLTEQVLSMWSEDPYLLFQEKAQSKEILNDLLRSTFKSTTRQGNLIFGQFKLDQVWEQIEHHTNKVNARIMNRISSMINDDAFMEELQQTEETDKPVQKEQKVNKAEAYKLIRDDNQEISLSAHYGSENNEDMAEDEQLEDNESEKDSSQVDSFMQGMEEDEMHALKMPSDLEGDDEEEDEEEGLFPEDDEGYFPEEDIVEEQQ